MVCDYGGDFPRVSGELTHQRNALIDEIQSVKLDEERERERMRTEHREMLQKQEQEMLDSNEHDKEKRNYLKL